MDSPWDEAFGITNEIPIFKLVFTRRAAHDAANLPSSTQVCMLIQREGTEKKHRSYTISSFTSFMIFSYDLFKVWRVCSFFMLRHPFISDV